MKLFHRNCRTELLPIVPILFVLLLLTALVSPVAATPVTWYLSGVTFADGGGASGSFTYESSNSRFTDWNVQAQGTTSGEWPYSFTFVGTNVSYPQAYWNLAGFAGSSVQFYFDAPGYEWYLSLFLPYIPLVPPDPVPLLSVAFTVVNYNDPPPRPYIQTDGRTGDAGWLTIPEPGTLLLLGTGLAGLWVWGRKKFKCI